MDNAFTNLGHAAQEAARAIAALSVLLRRRGPRMTRKQAVRAVRRHMEDGYHVRAVRLSGGDCAVEVRRSAGYHAQRKEERVYIRGKSWLGVRDAFHRMSSNPATYTREAVRPVVAGRKPARSYSWSLRRLLDPVRATLKKAKRRGVVLRHA